MRLKIFFWNSIYGLDSSNFNIYLLIFIDSNYIINKTRLEKIKSSNWRNSKKPPQLAMLGIAKIIVDRINQCVLRCANYSSNWHVASSWWEHFYNENWNIDILSFRWKLFLIRLYIRLGHYDQHHKSTKIELIKHSLG